MIYDIRHVTTYTYERSVSYTRCTLRITPLDGGDQRVISSSIAVTPPPAARLERTNFFGTPRVVLTIDAPHRELRIEARSRVAVTRKPSAQPEAGAPWEQVRDEAVASRSLAPSSPVHALFPSRLVPLSEALTDYARTSFPPARGVIQGAADLMNRIRADFAYEPGATGVSTSPIKAFESRRGVCQDFAHVMIAGLRGLCLPAAYVSGYIRTIPPPGKPRLQGADATHAWVAVWCGPTGGWLGFDPTNGILAGEDHVVLAVGRDYADVSPIDGVIAGSGAQKLKVAVDMEPVG